MKCNRKKCVVSSLLIATMTLGTLSGCALSGSREAVEPMEVEASNAISFDIIGGKDVMPIGGYYIPYSSTYSYNGNDLPNYISDEFYQMIDESGINFLAHSMTEYSTAPELVKQNLDFGEKYGIAMFVDDSTITGQAGEKVELDVAGWANKSGFEKSFVPKRVLSGTGAGDTSIAAFLTAMLEGCLPEECMQLATATGACCVENYDALTGLVSLEQLRQRIADGWRKAL